MDEAVNNAGADHYAPATQERPLWKILQDPHAAISCEPRREGIAKQRIRPFRFASPVGSDHKGSIRNVSNYGLVRRHRPAPRNLSHAQNRTSKNQWFSRATVFGGAKHAFGFFYLLTTLQPDLNKPPKVALLIETSNAYARGLLCGVVGYIREHQPWSVYLSEHTRGDKVPAWLAGWDGNGIIARIENRSIAEALRASHMPIVDMSAARLIPSLPWFETDDGAIAHLAAEHLLERGFKHFAYVGDTQFNWSKWRGEHFQNCVGAAGYKCLLYEAGSRKASARSETTGALLKWIAELPKPVGIMACYDFLGQQVLDACRRLDVAVPDEVAVIGVDNDDLLCELADPPLSSVVPNTYRTGYEAASLLDQMMAGKRVKGETHLIPPLEVVTRQSTDVLAIHDRNVARAINYIRKNACSGINVQDVIRAVPQSRRLLEKKFKKLLGRTPHEEIFRVQVNRVKQLLTATDLPLEEISERTGFTHVEYLSVAFKREVGIPPSRYRAVNRPKAHTLLDSSDSNATALISRNGNDNELRKSSE